MDNSQLFVTQHYRDFFSREPDAAGLQFWTNEIEQCGENAACREAKRVATSTAFLTSVEFGEVGNLVYRLYKAAFGNIPGAPVPVRFQQFLSDIQEIGSGLVVNQGEWRAQLEANKQAFVLSFVQRSEFQVAYPATMSPAEFVDKLNANTGGVLGAAERASFVSELSANNTSAGRASVLRKVAENAEFRQRETNSASVLLGYFGYLRRDPNEPPDTGFSGYNSRLSRLNAPGGEQVRAEMVKAFITSDEYRARFAAR